MVDRRERARLKAQSRSLSSGSLHFKASQSEETDNNRSSAPTLPKLPEVQAASPQQGPVEHRVSLVKDHGEELSPIPVINVTEGGEEEDEENNEENEENEEPTLCCKART
eukprot:g30715.t1